MCQARAVATRNVVLVGAARVFERRGFAATTIADILEEAGVSKGAMYFHFDTKEALAREIIAFQATWRDDATISVDCPVQHLIDLSHAFARALQHDPLVRASIRLTLERNTFQTADPSPYDGWLTEVETLLQQAADMALLLEGVEPAVGAHLITSAVTGTQLVSEATTGRTDLTNRITDMWRLLLPALVTPETLPSSMPGGSAGRPTSAA